MTQRRAESTRGKHSLTRPREVWSRAPTATGVAWSRRDAKRDAQPAARRMVGACCTNGSTAIPSSSRSLAISPAPARGIWRALQLTMQIAHPLSLAALAVISSVVVGCGSPSARSDVGGAASTQARHTEAGAPEAGSASDAGASSSTSPADGAAACAPASTTTCELPADTPLYGADSPAVDDGSGGRFRQPKFGGWASMNGVDAFDGYSVVVDWPGQPTALADSRNVLVAWPGIDLGGHGTPGSYFIQNGYEATSDPCVGRLWVEIFRTTSTASEAIYEPWTDQGTFCTPGDKLQFKAEIDGTSWVFSYRVVGNGDFVEQGRYDFGAAMQAVAPMYNAVELYDYAGNADQASPVTFSSILLKVNGAWRPAEKLVRSDDSGAGGNSLRLLLDPDPVNAGFVASQKGPRCYASGDLLWDATSACWASGVHCDSASGRCD